MQKGPDEHAFVWAYVYEGVNNGTVKVRQNCGGTVLKQVPDRRLKAPATEITAHLERMLNRIPVDVPPQLIFPRTGQLGIPMIDKIPK